MKTNSLGTVRWIRIAALLLVLLLGIVIWQRKQSQSVRRVETEPETAGEEAGESPEDAAESEGSDSEEDGTAKEAGKTAETGTDEPGECGTETQIGVHVSGAVAYPDRVWFLPEGSRIWDAIEAAGGAGKEADLTKLNLADFLVDGEKITVPSLMSGESDADGTSLEGEAAAEQYVVFPEGNAAESGEIDGEAEGDSESQTGQGLTNINKASKIELMELPGIGESYAVRILEYRELYGPFERVEDIMNVSGIGEAKFEALKDLISVE